MHGQLCKMEQPERDRLKCPPPQDTQHWPASSGRGSRGHLAFTLRTQHSAQCSGGIATCLVRAGPEWLCRQDTHTSWVVARALWAASRVTGGAGCHKNGDGLTNLWFSQRASQPRALSHSLSPHHPPPGFNSFLRKIIQLLFNQ